MNVDLVEKIRMMRLSYFELSDETTRARVIELFVNQRRHGFPSTEEVVEALNYLRDFIAP